MDDSISREAAIDALADMHCKSDEDGYVWIIRSDAWARIDALPSVTPEQKHGKWIVIMNEPYITFDECKCSECGVIEYFNKGWKKFSFCPNCGAKMDMERE